MSTTKKTTQTNQYTAPATAAQNTLSSTWSPIVQNPFGGPQYQMGLQQQMNAANQLNSNNIRNALNNANMAGMGNLTGGARMSLLSGLGRQASGVRQQGFFNNWNTAVAQQQFGSNVLGGLSGQLAGTTSTQKTSGLGTWLPQVIGAGLSLATGGLGGALSGAFGGGGSSAPGFGASQASSGNFGAPNVGYSGTGLPGQSFGGTNALFGGPNPTLAAPTPSPYTRF